MKKIIVLLFLTQVVFSIRLIEPFEDNLKRQMSNIVDTWVEKGYSSRKISPVPLCSDEVFLRRIYLDLIGSLPSISEQNQFRRDKRSNKRAVCIDELLQRSEYADYWTMKWCDVLRVKSEFPINLWPNAVQAYYRWIHQAIKSNLPYDEFSSQLLLASGSNFRVPEANFYRAMQGKTGKGIATAVALTFMGTRFEKLPKEFQRNLIKVFSKVAYKKTSEWKEEIVYIDPALFSKSILTLPGSKSEELKMGRDPRQYFVKWLTNPKNNFFARSAVNRIWFWLMGRGIIDEADDIYPKRKLVHSTLLKGLETEFIKSGYDVKALISLIVNSKTYQLSSINRKNSPDALLTHYIIRPIEAEVLSDMIGGILGKKELFSSQIPEPYTFIPSTQRTIKLQDGSITTSFLQMFNRPARDTGLLSERSVQPTRSQRLYMLNSNDIQKALKNNQRIKSFVKKSKNQPDIFINKAYQTVLCRRATSSEVKKLKKYQSTTKLSKRDVAIDLIWALLNSKEFLYKH